MRAQLLLLGLLAWAATLGEVRGGGDADASASALADQEAAMRSNTRLFPSMIMSAPMSSDEVCARDSRHLEAAIKNYTLWAITSTYKRVWHSIAPKTTSANPVNTKVHKRQMICKPIIL